MPIAPFPHRYSVALTHDTLLSDAIANIHVGPPAEFGGTGDVWSPEQLLVGAVLSCVKATFDAYAAKKHLAVYEWSGAATGVLVKGPQGPVFDCVDVEIEVVTDPGEESRVTELIENVGRTCIVSRSLAVPVHLTGKAVSILDADSDAA